MGVTNLLASNRSRAWLYGTLVLVFLRALPNLRYIIGRDQATYCVIAEGLLHGKLLYRDLWDNKPPGIFYIYAPIVKIFGPVMWFIGVVDILWLLIISCFIFYFARRYLGMAGAILAVIVYACRHCRQGYLQALQTESFVMLCVFAAWFLLCGTNPSPALAPGASSLQERGRGWTQHVARCFAVGLIMGAAFWLKYNAAIFFPFLALLPFVDFRGLDRVRNPKLEIRNSKLEIRNSKFDADKFCTEAERPSFEFPVSSFQASPHLLIPWKDWLGRMLMVAAGFVFAIVAVLAYFHVSGAWPAMKEVQFEVLPRYGAKAFHWSRAFLLFALQRTQEHLGIWWEVMPAVALLIAWWRRELGRIAPLTLLALAGYLGAASQGRFHPYYFETCFSFFAMFWAYVSLKTYEGVVQLQRIFVRRHWALARGLLWVLFASLVFSLLPEETVRIAEQYRYAADWMRNAEYSYQSYYWQLPLEKIGDQLRVVDYLKAHSQPRDEVFVWGTAALINFLSQRENPSRFVTNVGVMATWAPESWRQELARTIEARRPRYVVVERHDTIVAVTFSLKDSEQYLQVYPALASVLQRHYEPAVNYWDFEVYELK
ncbi:MAG TPA: glycosyltransferase family 39 protein [Terriglobia bacterium]|nr:glycosyltransferase family 39 protein [Terriglobia bacterium]